MEAIARVVTGNVSARAIGFGRDVLVAASGLPTCIEVTAKIDERKNLFQSIRVKPEEPQWLTAFGIDYNIITQLDWQII